MGVLLSLPNSSAKSIRRFYHYIQEKSNSGMFDDELVDLYEEIEREYGNLERDMESVEEQVEFAEEELEEIKTRLQDLKDDFKGMKRDEIYKEIERILI